MFIIIIVVVGGGVVIVVVVTTTNRHTSCTVDPSYITYATQQHICGGYKHILITHLTLACLI